ncbi:MAG: deaminase [Hyphomonadaceae bacterium]
MMKKVYSRSDFMTLAVEEHLKCKMYPRVGAVIAKDGALLSTGHRGEVDKRHAERVAIEKLDAHQLANATLFTTLEPCVGIYDDQIGSCSDLIIGSGITEVIIGVLDPNGAIYSQGYRKLLESDIHVDFFNRKLREVVEEETFEYGAVERLFGAGKRRVPVVHSGISLDVQFSMQDQRSINIRWLTLQPNHGSVDLHSANGAVRVASGARKFSDVTDPMVFRFSSHYARMNEGMISIVQPADATFCVLIKLVKIFNTDILFQWEVRNAL